MSDTARTYCLIFGGIELLGALLWAVAGAGIYGSPLAQIRGPELTRILLFLASGPFLVLPSILLSLRSRRVGGATLLAGGLLSAVLAGPMLATDAGPLPWLLVSLPMVLVGGWLLRGQTLSAGTAPVAQEAGAASAIKRTGQALGAFFLGLVAAYVALCVLMICSPQSLQPILAVLHGCAVLGLGFALFWVHREGEVRYRELLTGVWSGLALGLLVMAIR